MQKVKKAATTIVSGSKNAVVRTMHGAKNHFMELADRDTPSYKFKATASAVLAVGSFLSSLEDGMFTSAFLLAGCVLSTALTVRDYGYDNSYKLAVNTFTAARASIGGLFGRAPAAATPTPTPTNPFAIASAPPKDNHIAAPGMGSKRD